MDLGNILVNGLNVNDCYCYIFFSQKGYWDNIVVVIYYLSSRNFFGNSGFLLLEQRAYYGKGKELGAGQMELCVNFIVFKNLIRFSKAVELCYN